MVKLPISIWNLFSTAGVRVLIEKFPEQGTGLIKPVLSALAWLDQKIQSMSHV
jgi:hypothetical protein